MSSPTESLGGNSAERREWGSVPLEVHAAALDYAARHGAIPTAPVLADITGLNLGVVKRALRRLADDGALAQPCGDRGPYVPTRTPDGTPVRLVLVEEGSNQVGQDALVELVGKLPAEKRTAAEAYLRFLLEGGG